MAQFLPKEQAKDKAGREPGKIPLKLCEGKASDRFLKATACVDARLWSSHDIGLLSHVVFERRAIGLEPMAPSKARVVAQAVQDWIKAEGAKTAYIQPESPWD